MAAGSTCTLLHMLLILLSRSSKRPTVAYSARYGCRSHLLLVLIHCMLAQALHQLYVGPGFGQGTFADYSSLFGATLGLLSILTTSYRSIVTFEPLCMQK